MRLIVSAVWLVVSPRCERKGLRYRGRLAPLLGKKYQRRTQKENEGGLRWYDGINPVVPPFLCGNCFAWCMYATAKQVRGRQLCLPPHR